MGGYPALICVVAMGVGGCGAKAKPSAKAAPETTSMLQAGAAVGDPGAALIAREQEIWALEGLLVAEADGLLRSPAARAKLGDPKALAYQPYAEGTVRAFVRERRSPAVREAAARLVPQLNRPSRELLQRAADQAKVSAEDIFLDYLTCDALVDLAMMRAGYTRWKAGRLRDAALAQSFFAELTETPSARKGIKVTGADQRSIDINVFGARVRAEIGEAAVKFAPVRGTYGLVRWKSNYETLRAGVRGTAVQDTSIEELDFDGAAFAVNYAVELDEYLTWSAHSPWASMLYMLPADEVADMWAGIAATGGFEGRASAGNAAQLPEDGAVTDPPMKVRVVGAAAKPALAGVVSRRGRFWLVTVEVDSPADVRAPTDWFRLATPAGELSEFAMSRPGLDMAILIDAPRGAKTLAFPMTQLQKGTHTLVLAFDVPKTTDLAALLVGPKDVALRVKLK